jgi:hypothetical protein
LREASGTVGGNAWFTELRELAKLAVPLALTHEPAEQIDRVAEH